MTRDTKLMSGIIIVSLPTIMYGGYFLLTILNGEMEALGLTDFQKAMFRAGHAHAGVLTILSLLAQIFTDHTRLAKGWRWLSRVSFPAGALLVSGGFFGSAAGAGLTKANDLIVLIYLGIAVLAAGMITLGIGLIRK